MANYTEEDKKAFKLKDQLNSRMSALKATSINNEGKGIPAEDMLTEADKYYAWLYSNNTNVKESAPKSGVLSNASLPTPTAAQKKVLDAIQDKTGIEWDVMCKQVLDIAEEDYNIRKFPENMSSVAAFVSKLK